MYLRSLSISAYDMIQKFVCLTVPMLCCGFGMVASRRLAELDGRRDVVLERLLCAADAIRRQLLTAPRCQNAAADDYMFEDETRLLEFIVYLRDNISVGVSVCSGGGQQYCSWVFHQANFTQLTLTVLDMIKTILISSECWLK